MSKSRMMGAGNASASLYKTNPNINTFGGSKKQDIPTRVGIDAWANYGYQTSANGIGRNKLFIMNQIGGVGVGRSMFNTSYVQPRGLRKTVDISDIAYWDGVQHVLKKDVIIPVGHSLTTTSTFTVGQGTTLTVLGNFQSKGHIIVHGTLYILGTHDHGKMTISSTGSYNVSGKSTHNSNDPILKTVIDDTETDVADVNNQGKFIIQNGGNYTNAFTFTNLGILIEEKQTQFDIITIIKPGGNFTIDPGGIFTNAGTFNNLKGSTFIINGTYQNDGTVNHKTTMSETTGIKGTFSNNATLQLSLDTGATACNMYILVSSIITNSGTIIIDADCDFYSYVNWTNEGTVNNNGTMYIDEVSTFQNNKNYNNYTLYVGNPNETCMCGLVNSENANFYNSNRVFNYGYITNNGNPYNMTNVSGPGTLLEHGGFTIPGICY